MARLLGQWALWIVLGFSLAARAGVPKDLPLARGTPSGDELAAQVYFANHFYAFKNFLIRRHGRTMTVIINRNPNGRYTSNTVERYLNNDYPPDGPIKAKDLAIFRKGNLKGTGLLVTDYNDDSKPQSYDLWLPTLRKIRRFAQPAQDDAWGGTVFTFGDVTLRKPRHETHEVLKKTTFGDCLGAIKALQRKRFKYAGVLPSATCRHKGKTVYVLKSTTKFRDWWYDYRLSYVDVHSFADYRTEYYKGKDKVKVLDRDWGLVKGSGSSDPRALFWKYWYGRDFKSGTETWAVVPESVIKFNVRRRASFWSEKTLRKLKR